MGTRSDDCFHPLLGIHRNQTIYRPYIPCPALQLPGPRDPVSPQSEPNKPMLTADTSRSQPASKDDLGKSTD